MNDNRQSALPTGRVLVGDALERLRELPSDAVDTVVTSPPYFMLRDYQMKGQIGLEGSVEAYVKRLLAVLSEVGRVLKPEGTLWLNLGDTYARHPRHGAPPKSLVLAPERLMLALVEAGWTLRNKVVFAKSNPTPASVRDRLTPSWEPLLLLTRSRHYVFDLDGIRVPARSGSIAAETTSRPKDYGPRPQRPAWSGPLAGSNAGLGAMKRRGATSHELGKNPADVWTMATAAFKGAHFAVFPEPLVERCLRATCPERVCRSCGVAWRRAPTLRRLGAVALRGALRKSCGCESRAWQPGVVLDPFFGAGTVGLVAERLHRRWAGIELNPDFARLAEQRLRAGRNEDQKPAAA